MQIILISSRTLGASELLLLLSLFSHLFSPCCLFSCCYCCCFWSPLPFPPPSPPPLHRCHSSLSSLLPFCSGRWMALSSLRSRPGLTLSGCPIQWRVTGRFGRGGRSGGWEIWGSGATFWHLSVMWAGAKLSQWSQECSSKKKKNWISRSGLWEWDGFDVLHLSKTLKVKNIKRRRYKDLKKRKKYSEETFWTLSCFQCL